jgi:hypothetical protein
MENPPAVFSFVFPPIWNVVISTRWGKNSVAKRRPLAPQPGEEWLILAWFVVWTVGGVLALYAWLWQVMGKETVTVRGTTLSTRREIRGFGFGKDYDLMQINDVTCPKPAFPQVPRFMIETYLNLFEGFTPVASK